MLETGKKRINDSRFQLETQLSVAGHVGDQLKVRSKIIRANQHTLPFSNFLSRYNVSR